MTWGRHKLVLLFSIFFLTTCTVNSSSKTKPPEPVVGPSVIPLSVHYVTDAKNIRQKFNESLEKSNEVLMPHGILLVVWSEDLLYRLPHDVKTKQDRQLLGGRVLRDGTLHVFFADTVSLKPGDGLNGVHTRAGEGHRDFIILAKSARKTTLAHEVGHALGLDHMDTDDNVMSTGRDESKARFNSEQGKKMRAKARKFVQRDW